MHTRGLRPGPTTKALSASLRATTESASLFAGAPDDGRGQQRPEPVRPRLEDGVDAEAGPAELGEHVAHGADEDLARRLVVGDERTGVEVRPGRAGRAG